MAKSRDIPAEIIARRERMYKRRSTKRQVRERIESLELAYAAALEVPKPARDELLRYFPIGLVSVIEFFFRDQICTTFDSGSAEIGLIKQFVDKIDLEIAYEIECHKISIGEYVAHRIPINNLDE